MKVEVVCELKYDYWKESYGQGSWHTTTTFNQCMPWDGNESFEDMVFRNFPEFVENAKTADEDRNYRVVITSLRIGGEKSSIIIPIVKKTIDLKLSPKEVQP